MAKKLRGGHLSVRPSEAEQGGLGFPAGAVVTVLDAYWETWENAGPNALKGGRQAEDPCLTIEAEVEGVDDIMVHRLGAGKAARSQPSDDGNFLDPAEGSTAVAISSQSGANIFLESLSDKKTHKKQALDEVIYDAGMHKALTDLKFVADYKKVERDFSNEENDGQQRKNRPTLIAGEILEKPTGKKGKTRVVDEEEEGEDETEDTPAPKKAVKKKRKVADEAEEPEEEEEEEDEEEEEEEGGDAVEAAEAAIVGALDKPINRKGIPLGRAFAIVYNDVKENDELDKAGKKEAGKLAQDPKWIGHKDRPWVYDKDEELITKA